MIVFSGLDGAGKSTQIELLKIRYSKDSLKSFVFWSRGGYTPGMTLLKRVFLKKKKNIHAGFENKKNKKFSNIFVRKTWLILSIIDLIFFYTIYLRLKFFFGFKIICDRYIVDTLIDFKLNFPEETVEKWWLWKILNIFAIKPKKHFVLTTSVKESQKRSKIKKEPFPDSKETLKKRLEHYLNFAKHKQFAVHIDCNKGIKTIHNNIIKQISE